MNALTLAQNILTPESRIEDEEIILKVSRRNGVSEATPHGWEKIDHTRLYETEDGVFSINGDTLMTAYIKGFVACLIVTLVFIGICAASGVGK